MADLIFKVSPNIILGSYVITRLGQYAQEFGSKYMIIADPIVKEYGQLEKITKILTEKNVEYFIYEEENTSGDTKILQNALDLARVSHADGIIAIGGGRVISLGKAVCSLYFEEDDLYEYIDGKKAESKGLNLICIPTTMRDGFVFTDRTPVVDARSSKIKLIKSQNGLCKVILWDPSLSVAFSEKQISSMTVETLAVAVEAYMSQKATFFSDMLVEKSIELLKISMDGAESLNVTTPKEVLYTQGGCMASLAAATSSLGVCSLLSYALNARYKISRSLTSAIMLPYVIEDGGKFQAARLSKIAKILNICDKDAEDSAAVNSLVDFTRQQIAKINIPGRLKELDLTMDQIAIAVEDCGELDIMNTLPRSMTTDDLFELVKLAF